MVRTAVPDPPAPARPSHAIGVDLGIANPVACSDGETHPGVVEDRSGVTARQRELSATTTDTAPRAPTGTPRAAADGSRPSPSPCPSQRAPQRPPPGGSCHQPMRRRRGGRHRRRTPENHEHGPQPEVGGPDITAEVGDVPAPARGQGRTGRDRVRAGGLRNTSLGCSRCQHRKPKSDLPLSVRVYDCGKCGLRLDRDVDAAINVLVRAFGNEARKGGATPRCGQHAPATNGGPQHRQQPGLRARSRRLTRRPRPPQDVRGGLWPATDTPHSMPRRQPRHISPFLTQPAAVTADAYREACRLRLWDLLAVGQPPVRPAALPGCRWRMRQPPRA